MPASNNTVQQILDVLGKHLTRDQMLAVLKDLKENTTGNASYKQTIEKLYRKVIAYDYETELQKEELKKHNGISKLHDDM